MKPILTWKKIAISAYIWAFCTAGWAWIASVITTDGTILTALGCAVITALCIANS